MSASFFGPILILCLFLATGVAWGAELSTADAAADQAPLGDAVELVAERLEGNPDQGITAIGNVEMKKRDVTLTADRLIYRPIEDEAEGEGHISFVRETDHITGTRMRINLTESTGFIEDPVYSIRHEQMSASAPPDPIQDVNSPQPATPAPAQASTVGSGQAERIDFEGEGHYRFTRTTYSTCPASDPDWYMSMANLKLDYDSEEGSGDSVKLVFKDVPVLYSPWVSFSLNNQSKSGILPPTFSTNSQTGFQYAQPFYWNIAPNMDATITGRTMARRGTQLATDFRYIDFNYAGQARFEYLPEDNETGTDRSAYSVMHSHNFGRGLSGTLLLNGVSDDDYFSDLSTRLSVVSQGILARQGQLNYAADWWNASLMVQNFQTLQDPLEPIVSPYARLPRLAFSGLRSDVTHGLNFGLEGEFVQFSHPTLVEGQRTVLYPKISLPLQAPGGYITPSLGVHGTYYALDNQGGSSYVASQTRTLPIFSVDTGINFERDINWFDTDLTQTLEPRLYYLYVPSRNQDKMPVFDTALADFNFAQIFSDNRYVGSDRVGDANQVTAALVTRLVSPKTGAELARAMIGQRYYFSEQEVTLPAVSDGIATIPAETPRHGKDADFLAAVSGALTQNTYLDTAWQYSPALSATERFNIATRYQPEIGKAISAGYRFTRTQFEQIDVAAQWPIGGKWSGLARYNYSLRDNRMVEGLMGFEYTAGCWAIRGVLQQIVTTADSSTTSFALQLELTDFSSINIGSNPGDLLRRSIPGYGQNSGLGSDPVFNGQH